MFSSHLGLHDRVYSLPDINSKLKRELQRAACSSGEAAAVSSFSQPLAVSCRAAGTRRMSRHCSAPACSAPRAPKGGFWHNWDFWLQPDSKLASVHSDLSASTLYA